MSVGIDFRNLTSPQNCGHERKMRATRRALVFAAAILSIGHVTASGQEFAVTDDWSILILPAVKVEQPLARMDSSRESATATAPATEQLHAAGHSHQRPVVDPADYQRVYRSIPFNRAEYDANPTYRHDTTMEILTGNPRHQTIVKHTSIRHAGETPVSSTTPAHLLPYRYNNPDRGLNYYFYFPYWNYRGF